MQASPLLNRFAQAGARLGDRPEAPALDAVVTFGDVPGEVSAARERACLLDASDRGRVTVSGADAASFLHRILAGDVHGLEPGRGNRNLLLTPKGKVVSLFDLERLAEDRFHLSAPPGTEEALIAALDLYLFAEDVRLSPSGDEHAPLELAGPAAREVAAAALAIEPASILELEERRLLNAPDGTDLTPLKVAGVPGVRLDAGPEGAPALHSRLVEAGATAAGMVCRDVLRIEAGAALFGVDVDDNVYPQEARLEDAFSLEKGCYVGQEVVAKIDTYGGLNKLLLALQVEHDDPVPRGTRLVSDDAEGRDLGLVTSWTYSFALDTGLTLGYVKRKHQEPGTRFRLVLEDRELGRATIVPFPRPA